MAVPLPMSWATTSNASKRIYARADLVISCEAAVTSTSSPSLEAMLRSDSEALGGGDD